MCNINQCSLLTVSISVHQCSFKQIGVLGSSNWTNNIKHKHSDILAISLKETYYAHYEVPNCILG